MPYLIGPVLLIWMATIALINGGERIPGLAFVGIFLLAVFSCLDPGCSSCDDKGAGPVGTLFPSEKTRFMRILSRLRCSSVGWALTENFLKGCRPYGILKALPIHMSRKISKARFGIWVMGTWWVAPDTSRPEKGWPFEMSALRNPIRKWSYDSVEAERIHRLRC